MDPRILIVKLSSMGDIIHALPVPTSLRATFPKARLAWVVEKRWESLIANHPDLDEVLTVDRFRTRKRWHTLPELYRELRQVRRFRADWALDVQGTLKSAAVTLVSGAPHRVGFSARVIRESGGSLAYHHRIDPRSFHIVDQMLDVAEAIAPLQRRHEFAFPISDAVHAEIAAWLDSLQIKNFVFLSPGGGWAAKRWPSHRYAQLAQRLEQELGFVAILNRGPGETALETAFQQANAIRARLFSGDVPHLAALLSRARLVVGGDTGPLHLAAVMGRPVVALYGPTDPIRNGPYSAISKVLRRHGETTYRRSNRHSSSMLALTVDEVLQACRDLLRSLPLDLKQGAGPA